MIKFFAKVFLDNNNKLLWEVVYLHFRKCKLCLQIKLSVMKCTFFLLLKIIDQILCHEILVFSLFTITRQKMCLIIFHMIFHRPVKKTRFFHIQIILYLNISSLPNNSLLEENAFVFFKFWISFDALRYVIQF